MAGKAKFDQESAFKSIVGIGRGEQPEETTQAKPAEPEKKSSKKAKPEAGADKVQRSYYLEKDIDKALKMKALREEINLTQAINEALRKGLAEYL